MYENNDSSLISNRTRFNGALIRLIGAERVKNPLYAPTNTTKIYC